MFNVKATGGAKMTGVPASVGLDPAGKVNSQWAEIGTVGLSAMAGYIQAAYQAELRWPTCYPVYNRLRRSDPEVSTVRQIFSAMASRVHLEFQRPETDIPENDDDKRALEFAQSSLSDLEGGAENFLDTLVAQVPFMGWGYWEAVPGLRRKDWQPPGEDPWRSQNDDGLAGFRRLAWRDHSSFFAWDLDERTGRLRGMTQLDAPNATVTIPIGRAVHITFGDSENPEGLATLEALYRLERIKFGLEVVNGIGFEHAAGYLSVSVEQGQPDSELIKKAARAIMTAQEGNYAAWPAGVTGELKDVPFTAGPALLEAIKYYGMLKLTLFNMQWVAMSTISGTGSFAALKDSSGMWLVAFNAMMAGFARQMDNQYGKRLFAMNPDAFPGMTVRPQLVVTPVEKEIDLNELATFLAGIKDTMPLGDDDFLAVRRKSGFLPVTLPEVVEPETVADDAPADDSAAVDDSADDAADDVSDVPADAEMAERRQAFDAAMGQFTAAMKQDATAG